MTGDQQVVDLTPEEIQALTPTISNVQATKIAEIQQAYDNALSAFPSSATTGDLTKTLIYDYSVESQILWRDLFTAIDKGFFPDAVFPMEITLKNGSTVPHTKSQIQQIEADIAIWKFPLYQKYQKIMTKDIPNAPDVNAINAITW
jgi:hypothetical protein